jgi:general stress protein YciG
MKDYSSGKYPKRGFAAMDPDKQRKVAAKGGHGVPAHLRSFSQDRELAAAAGRVGGKLVPNERRSFSINKELAAEAGRKGGKVRRKNADPIAPKGMCETCYGAGEVPSNPNAVDFEDMGPALPCPECGGTGDA